MIFFDKNFKEQNKMSKGEKPQQKIGNVSLTRRELFEKFKELKSKVYETILRQDKKGFERFTKEFYKEEGDANSCIITSMLVAYCEGMVDSLHLNIAVANFKKVFGGKDSCKCNSA
jgi:deoxyhypusine synthase